MGLMILSFGFISISSILIVLIKSNLITSLISILSSGFFLSNLLIKSLHKLSFIGDKSISAFNIALLNSLFEHIRFVSIFFMIKGDLKLVRISNNNIPHFHESNFEFLFFNSSPLYKLFISSGE